MGTFPFCGNVPRNLGKWDLHQFKQTPKWYAELLPELQKMYPGMASTVPGIPFATKPYICTVFENLSAPGFLKFTKLK